MEKPILSYLPADAQHGAQPIEIRFGDLIERRNRDGSSTMWHAVIGNLYNNKGAPVIVALLRSAETVRVSAFPRHLLEFSRRSDAEHCSVFRLRQAEQTAAQPTAAASTAPAAQPVPPPATTPAQQPATSDFPPGMMAVGMDIDTTSGSVTIHGRQRDSDKDKDKNST